MVVLDNLGFILAGFFRAPTTGAKDTGSVLRKLTGALFSTRLYSTNSDSILFNDDPVTRQAQVGSGSTLPTRQDFNVETPFVSAPESVRNSSLNGGYNSGLGKIEQPTLISPTGGAGTITEVVKYILVQDGIGGGATEIIALFRDVITGVGFIAGQSINITHEVLI